MLLKRINVFFYKLLRTFHFQLLCGLGFKRSLHPLDSDTLMIKIIFIFNFIIINLVIVPDTILWHLKICLKINFIIYESFQKFFQIEWWVWGWYLLVWLEVCQECLAARPSGSQLGSPVPAVGQNAITGKLKLLIRYMK